MRDDAEDPQDRRPSPLGPPWQSDGGSAGASVPSAGDRGNESLVVQSPQAPSAGAPLPWFTGFLLLFPPALVAYLLWKLISQAGSFPPDEDDECRDGGAAVPPRPS